MRKFIAALLAFSLSVMLCACNRAHEHTYSDEWYYDENYHWQIPTCGDTDELGNFSVHNFIQGVCRLCGYSPDDDKQADFYDVTYDVSGGVGGTIEGEKTQRVPSGGDATSVTAVPDPGFFFVMWSDGEIETQRQDKYVKQNLTISAIFEPDYAEDPDIDDENFGNDHVEEEDNNEVTKGESVEENGLIFTEMKSLVDDEVTGYSVKIGQNAKTSYNIPKTFKDKPVLKIEDYGFKGSGITSITIPDSIITIGNQSFMECTRLSSITIPDTVEDVGTQSFQSCTNLYTVKLSNKMQGVWYKMFYGCAALTEIDLPDSVTQVGRYAFGNCLNLKRVKFGKGITKCGAKAFINSKNIDKVEITDLKAWCETSFDYFYGTLNSEEGSSNPLFYGHQLIMDGEPLTEVNVPDGTSMISMYAFVKCETIQHVKVPSSVKVIGEGAFKWCSNLETIELSEGLIKTGSSIFFRCHKLKEVNFPDSLTLVGEANSQVTDENIGYTTIEDCDSITKISLGKKMKINSSLIVACEQLTDIDFRGTVHEWDDMDKDNDKWMTQCADTVKVHCIDDGKDVIYKEVWKIKNYLKYLSYERTGTLDTDKDNLNKE